MYYIFKGKLYWNLSNIKKLQIDADYYLDGEDMIPLDTPFPVKNTLMDFTHLRPLTPSILEVDGGGMPGIDHAFVLRHTEQGETKKKLRRVATLQEDESGRRLEIATTEHALIVYTSNWLNEQPPFVPVSCHSSFHHFIISSFQNITSSTMPFVSSLVISQIHPTTLPSLPAPFNLAKSTVIELFLRFLPIEINSFLVSNYELSWNEIQ